MDSEREAAAQVMPEDERLSKWELRTEQLGRTWEFSWLAQNLTPTKLQKIHWRSVQVRTACLSSWTACWLSFA